MGEPASNLELVINTDTEYFKDIKESIFNTHTDELIIGLCGPIGTDIHFVADSIEKTLIDKYNYRCVKIRLSVLIRQYASNEIQLDENSDSKFDVYQKLINGGNILREKHTNSILAELAINEIAYNREISKKDDYGSERVCYIIDSIKNKEELEIFRLIYGDIFYFIGVFSSVESRVQNLVNKGIKTHEVHRLIDRDSGEEMNFGQDVTNTFTESDFFLRVDFNSKSAIEPKINRFLNLIFSTEVITPSSDETAMYLAAAAAGNSACLSRQVGAAITDSNGELISVGWNDVPKVGGSVYKYNPSDLSSDKRCYNYGDGLCFNDSEKGVITDALVNELILSGVIDNSQRQNASKVIKKSRIKELIEFSRAVHAEMLAIITGSQKAGDRVINGKLYCTTYPCHNCARHIVAAGIKEIYYIEPYRKSLAIKLHNDSITEDESNDKLVRILMFDGISPRRYLQFFKMIPNSRKRDGKKINNLSKHVSPKNTLSLQAIPILEGKVTQDLKNKKLIDA
ncbi:anti-phage dCTP deaminase [Mucilaginibacter polytrichastri]|uniref:CMP/dCMP-type deaminase domain-containing protein n=1 Tax=Mucilaginibacter polytrichastri TaxID=1302689 RepID=A0A1Q6A5I6_9SPHI|nr:anti-phage dCTP deaminase [Mucilaginibacter polytrichastri]OKS89275.1 hypothetical protein RG47T_4759 [Mucilaginibacter polytrichastri]SFS75239.1 Deoxycytidylate deaminase [Mucilaginibacter polytrichastri]